MTRVLQGETFGMRSPVRVAGPVEVWMLAVEGEMRATLHTLAKQGVHGYPSLPRTRWIGASLGMVGLVGSTIWWTWETEDAFRRVAAGEKSALKVHASTTTCDNMSFQHTMALYGGLERL